MSLTQHESEMLEQQDINFSFEEKFVVQYTMDTLFTAMKEAKLRALTDDAAAKVEAAVINFIIVSKNR